MNDTAEFWQSVRNSHRYRMVYTHYKGMECGHYHCQESKNLDSIDCNACLKLIDEDPELKDELIKVSENRKKQIERSRRCKKGIRLDSIIKFGKYKGHQKSMRDIYETDRSYFNWVLTKYLSHPEIDDFLAKK